MKIREGTFSIAARRIVLPYGVGFDGRRPGFAARIFNREYVHMATLNRDGPNAGLSDARMDKCFALWRKKEGDKGNRNSTGYFYTDACIPFDGNDVHTAAYVERLCSLFGLKWVAEDVAGFGDY